MPRTWDEYLFRLLNEGWTCSLMDAAARALQHAWIGFLVGVILGIFLVARGGRRAWIVLLACAAAVIASDLTCTYLLKPLVARPRPSAVLEGVRLLLGRKSGLGFPSNHAANLAAFSTPLALAYPRWAPLAAAATLFVGYTRIYAGVHYPSDVLGGFMVGLIFGTAAFLVAGPYARADKRTA